MWEYVMKNALKLTSIPSYRSSFNITFNVQSWEKDFLQYGFYRLNEWGYAAKTTRYSDIFRKINFCMTKNRSSEAKMFLLNLRKRARFFCVYTISYSNMSYGPRKCIFFSLLFYKFSCFPLAVKEWENVWKYARKEKMRENDKKLRGRGKLSTFLKETTIEK